MKLHLFYKILILTLILSSCAPTSYVYLKPDAIKTDKIDEVILVVEYLSAKEGLDDYWDFDEDLNLKNQNYLHAIAENMLSEKGYMISDKSLKTSGLIMNRGFELDHYLNGKKQKQLISPPYIVRSTNLSDESIRAVEDLLAELNSPISSVMQDYRSHLKNNYKAQTENIAISNNTALLLIEVYRPRKSLLTNIEFGFSDSNWDSHVGFGSYQPPASCKAFLIHKGSGDVLWSNKIALITKRNQRKFFAEIPQV